MNLDDIRIAMPCPANWADMAGDDRQRFCGLCKLHVYNIADMTRADAEALLGGEAKVCVRLYRRVDGTVITRDCPFGLRAASHRFFATLAAGVTVLFAALLWGMNELRDGDHYNWGRLATIQPFKAIVTLVKRTEPDPTKGVTPLTGSPMPSRTQ